MVNPKCPDLKVMRTYCELMDEVFEGYFCALNDKVCLLETGMECEIYNEWLKEEQEEDIYARVLAEDYGSGSDE